MPFENIAKMEGVGGGLGHNMAAISKEYSIWRNMSINTHTWTELHIWTHLSTRLTHKGFGEVDLPATKIYIYIYIYVCVCVCVCVCVSVFWPSSVQIHIFLVIIVCEYRGMKTFRRIMKMAHRMLMTTNDYVFISYGMVPSDNNDQPWVDSAEGDVPRSEAYNVLKEVSWFAFR